MFLSHCARRKGSDEELASSGPNEIVPVKLTERFSVGKPDRFYRVLNCTSTTNLPGLRALSGRGGRSRHGKVVVVEDAMYIAPEDQTGYLKLFRQRAVGNRGGIVEI